MFKVPIYACLLRGKPNASTYNFHLSYLYMSPTTTATNTTLHTATLLPTFSSLARAGVEPNF